MAQRGGNEERDQETSTTRLGHSYTARQGQMHVEAKIGLKLLRGSLRETGIGEWISKIMDEATSPSHQSTLGWYTIPHGGDRFVYLFIYFRFFPSPKRA